MRQLDFAEGAIFVIDGDTFHGIQGRVCTVDDLAKYRILCVEMRLLGIGDEELGFVRIRARVGHGNYTASIELKGRPQFVGKAAAPNTLATFTRAGRVASLDHETFDVAMKNATIIVV